MLPPQLRRNLVPSHSLPTIALRASLAPPSPLHPRTFWSWRRDWASHLDPVYHRFSRIRTLKTRAKLLRSLRRRGKFDWDFDSKPFFTPRLVVGLGGGAQQRWASHWDGSGRRCKGWFLDGENSGGDKKAEGKAGGGEAAGKKIVETEEDGFELSAREKEWREKMEAMRRRIEKDPYEAIFGKRFEPFWSPLVPSWMREEMGLQGWPKAQPKDAAAKEPVKTMPDETVTKTVKNETADKARPNTSQPVPPKKDETADSAVKSDKKWTAPQPSTYSYASSTSWDSWTNKTRKVEWDSVSGQTRKYEYDPISNRMVQIEAPKPSAPEAKAIEPTAGAVKAPVTPVKDNTIKTSSGSKPAETKAVNIPVQQAVELRKSIPIPPPLSQPSHSVPLGIGKCNVTSIGPLKSTAIASDVLKPSALAKLPEKQKLPEKDVDSLTADDVRAAMGKARDGTTSSVVKLNEEKSEIEAMLKERDTARSRMHVPKETTTQWDQAEMGVMLDKELESLEKKKEKLLKDERGLFHIERQKRELQKLDERIKEVTARVEKLNVVAAAAATAVAAVPASKTPPASSSPAGLQPSLERLQSKNLSKLVEPDDAAAHESTEPLAAFNGVPRNWSQQAELLQADRVRRTASKLPYPMQTQIPVKRFEDDMGMRKAAYEAKKASEDLASGKTAAEADRKAKLEKANKMLEAEVAEQKMKMQAHETRYAHKIRALRQELEVAYKQSTVHSEKHLERVRYLEQELEKAQKATGATNAPSAASIKPMNEEMRKREVEKAEQKARDNALVKEVKDIYESAYGVIDAAHRQPPAEKTTKQKPAVQVVEVESDVDLGEALARYEREAPPYKVQQLALENKVAAQEREFHEGKKLVDDKMPRLIPTEMARMAAEEKASKSLPATVQWEEPPVYKVLAYDSGNDMMSTATTTSNFTGAEAPISIPQALSQLYQPARFVPYFAELQKDGYQVIYGTKDLLVFKKVKGPQPLNKSLEKVDVLESAPRLVDHGLVGMEKTRTSSEKELEAKTAHTGNAAPASGLDEPSMTTNSAAVPGSQAVEQQMVEEDAEEDIEWRHYPRVRRMEQHFTGSRRRWNSSHRRHSKRFEEREKDLRRRHKKRTLKWVLGVGLGTATVMYIVGAAAEKARERRDDDWRR